MKSSVDLLSGDEFYVERKTDSGVVWIGFVTDTTPGVRHEIPILREQADAIILALQEVCY